MNDDERGYYLRLIERVFAGIKVAVIVIGLVVGGNATLSIKNWDDISENTAYNQSQSLQINDLQQEVFDLKLLYSSQNIETNDLKSGFCICVNDKQKGEQKLKRCLAKNFVCDEDSRRHCVDQNPGYSC